MSGSNEMKRMAALEGGTAPVRCLAFSRGGETLGKPRRPKSGTGPDYEAVGI